MGSCCSSVWNRDIDQAQSKIYENQINNSSQVQGNQTQKQQPDIGNSNNSSKNSLQKQLQSGTYIEEGRINSNESDKNNLNEQGSPLGNLGTTAHIQGQVELK